MKTEFRSDSLFGAYIREPVKVIQYETFELGNADIGEYILQHYNIPQETKETWEWIINQLVENECVELSTGEKEEAAQMLVDAVQKDTQKKIFSVIWLAQKELLLDLYRADESDIDEYEVSDVILSDLGPDGRLYAYDYDPQPVL